MSSVRWADLGPMVPAITVKLRDQRFMRVRDLIVDESLDD